MPASAKPTGTKKNRVELCVRSLENGHDSFSRERLVSRCRINLIGPGMDDGFSVEVIEVGEDPRLEFFLGCDANAAEHGPRHLGDVGGVVVEDQLDGGICRVSGVEFLQKADKLPRTMAIFDAGVNLTGQ